MSEKLKVVVFAGAMLAVASGTASAHGHVSFSVTFGAPAVVAPAPVYYAPPPAPVAYYYAPAPAYPVYYAPMRVVRPHGWRVHRYYRSWR